MIDAAGGWLGPLLAPAHLMALIAVALMAGRQLRPGWMVAAFAAGLAGGLGAIGFGVGETPAVDVLLAGAAVCGVTTAAGLVVPATPAALLALALGVALGLDSPPDTLSLRIAELMLIATAGGGTAALAGLALAAATLARRWQAIVLRVAGSWLAAIAILVLALRWAG